MVTLLRLIPLEPNARLTIGLWWVPPPPPIPSTVYGTNAESYKYPLWHVARAAQRMSQIFSLLFLGNGWANGVEILYAIGIPLVSTYAVVTRGVSMHPRTCRDTPLPHIHTQRFCISETV